MKAWLKGGLIGIFCLIIFFVIGVLVSCPLEKSQTVLCKFDKTLSLAVIFPFVFISLAFEYTNLNPSFAYLISWLILLVLYFGIGALIGLIINKFKLKKKKRKKK